eukprot:RCo026092
MGSSSRSSRPWRPRPPRHALPRSLQGERKKKRNLYGWVPAALRVLQSVVDRLRPGQQRATEVYHAKMKPTTRLILIVVALSLVMTLAVAGTGIGLSYNSSINQRQADIQQEVGMVLHAVEAFTVTQARTQALTSQLNTARMMAEVVQGVGYDANVETSTKRALSATRIAAMFSDSLFLSVAKDRALSRARVLANSFTVLCEMGFLDLPALISVVNRTNFEQYPNGFEAFVVGNSSGTPSILSPLRNCVGPSSSQPAGCTTLNDDLRYAMALSLTSAGGTLQG